MILDHVEPDMMKAQVATAAGNESRTLLKIVTLDQRRGPLAAWAQRSQNEAGYAQ